MDPRPVVYVVDDEPALRDLARRTVESMALDVECFASGRQFLDQFDPLRVSCLVTDLMLPDLTGQQLLEILAERRATIPAIMISGHGNIPAAVRAMEIGAIGFLEKPCALDTLRDTIRKAIELARRRRQGATPAVPSKDRLALLTDDERVTMQMIVRGMADKAIATEQDVCVRTVEYRRAAVLEKLGVKTRAELIRIAPSEGAISGSDEVPGRSKERAKD